MKYPKIIRIQILKIVNFSRFQFIIIDLFYNSI